MQTKTMVAEHGAAIERDAIAEAESCSICLEGYARLRRPLRLACGHRFHASCIVGWRLAGENGIQCPLCRRATVAGSWRMRALLCWRKCGARIKLYRRRRDRCTCSCECGCGCACACPCADTLLHAFECVSRLVVVLAIVYSVAMLIQAVFLARSTCSGGCALPHASVPAIISAFCVCCVCSICCVGRYS